MMTVLLAFFANAAQRRMCPSKNCLHLFGKMSKILPAPQELNPLGFEMHDEQSCVVG